MFLYLGHLVGLARHLAGVAPYPLVFLKDTGVMNYVTVPSKSNEMGGREPERKCVICSIKGSCRLRTSALSHAHPSRCFCSIRSQWTECTAEIETATNR